MIAGVLVGISMAACHRDNVQSMGVGIFLRG